MEKNHIAIAIDGPVAAGKTTQAKLLAKEFGFLYVDTGAMYRTIAVFMTWFPTLAPSMEKVLACINMTLKRGQDGEQRMFLGTEDVTDQLRTPKISKLASDISALPCVRDFLLGMQRKAAEENDVVMEGRDIGTVILPDATVKIFLTADSDVRVCRRWLEMKRKGQPVGFHQVMADLIDRDYNDSHREIAPLRQAKDAILLDCTDLSIRETTNALLELVREIVGR